MSEGSGWARFMQFVKNTAHSPVSKHKLNTFITYYNIIINTYYSGRFILLLSSYLFMQMFSFCCFLKHLNVINCIKAKCVRTLLAYRIITCRVFTWWGTPACGVESCDPPLKTSVEANSFFSYSSSSRRRTKHTMNMCDLNILALLNIQNTVTCGSVCFM